MISTPEHLTIFCGRSKGRKKGTLASIRFCPTDLMIGDYMTKPLHGQQFTQFQQEIMNLLIAAQLIMWHCIHLPS